jgi:hypothetical protein
MNGPLGTRDDEGGGLSTAANFRQSSKDTSTPDGSAPLRRVPDFTREHRVAVVRFVSRVGLLGHPRMSEASKLLFVVSALMADPNGVGSPDTVQAAMQDPSLLQAARAIMIEAVAS